MQTERGLTLIELLVFIVIVGIAATAILGVFGGLTRNSASLLPEKQAQAFAASKLVEIMAEPFATVVSKYNGANTMTFPDTTAVANLPYTVLITAVAATAGSVITSSPAAAIPPADRLLVTVVVTAPNGTVSRLQGIRVR
ncbi:MAG TPA: prepilin-type N-terminal cleavage/methylation domain-containing protein [Thiobacillus sp.]|nr:prepilin-type N-terminal cleavage/methylation domain-containing protein [Thiobacillus sp.]HQT71439.1 prepilin-type N-terminal cleavage/methylation domain-containing protein [Thiobacillus sp.]